MATNNNPSEDGLEQKQSLLPLHAQDTPNETEKLIIPTHADPIDRPKACRGGKKGLAALMIPIVAVIILIATFGHCGNQNKQQLEDNNTPR